ncbi:MAG: hypothetical protein QOE50_1054, partial [Sphingomonadales bacterium]|nr:hypothetical protein [Sphingomonadales bacterium]
WAPAAGANVDASRIRLNRTDSSDDKRNLMGKPIVLYGSAVVQGRCFPG